MKPGFTPEFYECPFCSYLGLFKWYDYRFWNDSLYLFLICPGCHRVSATRDGAALIKPLHLPFTPIGLDLMKNDHATFITIDDLKDIDTETKKARHYADRVIEQNLSDDQIGTYWHLIGDCLQNIERIVRTYLPSRLE